ncbi:MAG TPA: hypothetical protein VMV39_04795 [Terracidiphilus sp.]|nr:hypothetical protein [Terracidiphilus sp.]
MTESDLEIACIACFQELGYAYKAGPDIAPRGATPERKNFVQVIHPLYVASRPKGFDNAS